MTHIQRQFWQKRCLPLLLALFAPSAFATIPVHISEDYSAITYSSRVTLDTKQPEILWVTGNTLGDHYELNLVDALNPVRVVVFDTKKLDDNQQPDVLLNKVISKGTVENINVADGNTLAIALTTESASPSPVVLTVFRKGKRSEAMRNQIKPMIESAVMALDSVYHLPQFQIFVRPCGVVNAFSAPDVTICTELLADLNEKNLDKAILMVILHEMGHSLLRLWHLPGWDNEEMVDEFAATFLAKGYPESIVAWSQWLRQADSVYVAKIQLNVGDRHPLPIQRARNIEAILKNPDPVMTRWSILLSRYTRPLSKDTHDKLKTTFNFRSDLSSLEGVCDSLHVARMDKTAQCGGAILLFEPREDRHTFIIQTLDNHTIGFSGGKITATDTSIQVMHIDQVVMATDQREKPVFLKARGKCLIYGNPEQASDIQCDAIAAPSDSAYNVRFKPTTPWKLMY